MKKSFKVVREKKEKLSRKRSRDETSWKRAIAKKARNSGGEVASAMNNKNSPAKIMGEVCGCRLKCGEKLTHEERTQIFSSFWKLPDHTRQWDYIARFMKSHVPTERTVVIGQNEKFAKSISNDYSLPNSTATEVKVCRRMFIATLGENDSS